MRPKLLHVTDFYYQAQGRKYYQEDLNLSLQLSHTFDLILCHPKAAHAFINDVDIILFRNTGPVLYYADSYADFKTKVQESGVKIYNQISGKADMVGKQYLVDLSKNGYPVIPSVDDKDDLEKLPIVDQYVTKLKLGADSVGMQFISPSQLHDIQFTDNFVQPVMDFDYEVSFYFINHEFQYALYAPNPECRWKLQTYHATGEDIEFAQTFINWNDIEFGIQRIDACKNAGWTFVVDGS